MSTVSERVAQIKAEKVGQTGKRVLLLEGTDDVDAYSIFLTKRFPQWDQSWAVAEMGNKRQVLEGLARERNWLGLVDKDEWSDEVQTALLHKAPSKRAFPNPRRIYGMGAHATVLGRPICEKRLSRATRI